MKKLSSVFPFLLMFITNGCLAQNKTIELKFNLPVGAAYDYNTDMNITTEVNIARQKINVNNTIAFGYHFDVIGDSAGWKKLSSTIARIAMKLNTAGANINYDSDKPLDTSDFTSGMIGKALGALKGGQFTFSMNEKGEIGSVSGINELLNKLSSEDSDEGIDDAFKEENFKQDLRMAFGAYPANPVKLGDSWTITTNANNAGIEMKMKNVYTLESIMGNIANVKVNSTIFEDSSTNSNGTMTGFIKYDIPTGVAVDGELNMQLKESNPQLTSDTQMPTDVKVKMKIAGKKS